MRNDVFFVVTAAALAGVAAVLLPWLDGQQRYLLAHWRETDAVNIEPAGNTAPATLDLHFDYAGTELHHPDPRQPRPTRRIPTQPDQLLRGIRDLELEGESGWPGSGEPVSRITLILSLTPE